MQFRKAEQEDLTLNLAPLIDVVFLLLIFFMVTTSFTKENALDLNLPEGDFEAIQSDILSITMSISKHDEIFFQHDDAQQQAANGNLIPQIQAAIEQAKKDKPSLSGLEPTILIKADRAASHGRVIQLMDAISKLGIHKIQFIAVSVQN